MSGYPAVYNPVVANPNDGENITLCKILESVAVGGSLTTGFAIPAYNDVEFQYQNGAFPTYPTYITFKQNGNAVYYLYLQYDVNGALTKVAQD
jgi:hypothetical protein